MGDGLHFAAASNMLAAGQSSFVHVAVHGTIIGKAVEQQQLVEAALDG